KNATATAPSAASEAATTTAIQRRFILAPPLVCGRRPPAMPILFREDAEQPLQRIIVLIDDAFLERNDRVVGDGDALRTHFGAALGDVAVAEAISLLQIRGAVLDIERVHLQRRRVDEEARADELAVLVVVAQHVADVLAQETLDALAELLHAL